MEGVCDNNLTLGQHSIEVYMGGCASVDAKPVVDVISGGFDVSSRLYVEEIIKDNQIDQCKQTILMRFCNNICRNAVYSNSHLGLENCKKFIFLSVPTHS